MGSLFIPVYPCMPFSPWDLHIYMVSSLRIIFTSICSSSIVIYVYLYIDGPPWIQCPACYVSCVRNVCRSHICSLNAIFSVISNYGLIYPYILLASATPWPTWMFSLLLRDQHICISYLLSYAWFFSLMTIPLVSPPDFPTLFFCKWKT